MKTGKRKTAVLLALALAALMLTACGKSEFGMIENDANRMVISAENASRDGGFTAGSLEVADGEQIVIAANLEKGSVRVEILPAPEEQSISNPQLPDGEAIITADLKTSEGASGTVDAGSYYVRATCLEKATGTVEITVAPAP